MEHFDVSYLVSYNTVYLLIFCSHFYFKQKHKFCGLSLTSRSHLQAVRSQCYAFGLAICSALLISFEIGCF